MDQKKVATEVAEQEFARWAEAMGLEFDRRGWDADDTKGFESNRLTIIRAIENGALVLNENGEFIYTPTVGDDALPITFHEPRGKSFIAMDKQKQNHMMTKQLAMVSSITHEPLLRFEKMRNRDLKVCNAIANLFLA
jgi:hypothetical protein